MVCMYVLTYLPRYRHIPLSPMHSYFVRPAVATSKPSTILAAQPLLAVRRLGLNGLTGPGSVYGTQAPPVMDRSGFNPTRGGDKHYYR